MQRHYSQKQVDALSSTKHKSPESSNLYATRPKISEKKISMQLKEKISDPNELINSPQT